MSNNNTPMPSDDEVVIEETPTPLFEVGTKRKNLETLTSKTSTIKKRKGVGNQEKLQRARMWLKKLVTVLHSLDQDWKKDFPLTGQVNFFNLQSQKDQDVLLELPLLQTTSWTRFLALLGDERQGLSEKLSGHDISPGLIQNLITFVEDCKKKAESSGQSLNMTTTTTSSTAVSGPGHSANASIVDNSNMVSGFSALLSYNPLSISTGPISSTISVQTNTSYNTYTAPLDITDVIMDCALYRATDYMKQKDRWRESYARYKAVPLTQQERMTINSVMDKIAERVRASPHLQVSFAQKKQRDSF